jgi:alpha-mannosidase
MAEEQPATLDELRRAIEAGTTSIVGGTYHDRFSEFACSESWLAEINLAQAAARRHLEREYKVFGQFHSAFSPVLPDVLQGTGFEGALHVSFDGGRLPRTEQCKTWWGPEGQAIPALAATPLDASLPETWLKFAERIGDTIAHDHVATVLLASWPGQESEFFEDFRRAARYGPVLGKVVTLEEYFRVTREADDWTRFHTREYPSGPGKDVGPNPISSQVGDYRRAVSEIHERLASGLAAAADLKIATSPVDTGQHLAVLNAWNFVCTKLTQVEPLRFPTAGEETISPGVPANSEGVPRCLPDVPGCGFATFAAAAPIASVPLAEGRTLRNELLEVTVSESTGGIQSVRAHRDRSTRVSQRLVFQQGRSASLHDTQMISEKITVTRNDALVGEIESQGRLLDASDGHLAQFRQRVRMVRGMPGVFVDVQLEPQQLPEGDLWRSYYASRLAFTDEAIGVRRGAHWLAFDTAREWIESPEWVEINDGTGTVACLSLGLPYHRRATANWLDTLLLSAGEDARQFQFAIALDHTYLTQLALALLTAGPAPLAALPAQPGSSRGWFLHVAAKNIVVTHIEPIASSSHEASSHDSTASAPPARNGLRIRLLETEGRAARTQLSAFRAFSSARTTDLRGNSTGVLSTTDGNVDFDIGAHRWIQIEAEW